MLQGAGSYFGEMALLLNEPRQANVIAIGNVKLLSMERKQFDALLGRFDYIKILSF
jgi:cAMP-dependent protein kinase regulator